MKKDDIREVLKDALDLYKNAGFRSFTSYNWREIELYLDDLFELDDNRGEQ